MPRPAVFLDRDGTLNREVNYLADPADLELIPGCAGALESLRASGFALVVATNQSGIARGLLTEEKLGVIHSRLEEMLGLRFDAIEYCPHQPEHGPPEYRKECRCRKPEPGMLQSAARRLDLDLRASWTIGDSERDLLAGQRAGTRGILVGTGKGEAERERMRQGGAIPELFATDIVEAARWVAAGQPG